MLVADSAYMSPKTADGSCSRGRFNGSHSSPFQCAANGEKEEPCCVRPVTQTSPGPRVVTPVNSVSAAGALSSVHVLPSKCSTRPCTMPYAFVLPPTAHTSWPEDAPTESTAPFGRASATADHAAPSQCSMFV